MSQRRVLRAEPPPAPLTCVVAVMDSTKVGTVEQLRFSRRPWGGKAPNPEAVPPSWGEARSPHAPAAGGGRFPCLSPPPAALFASHLAR